MKEQTVSDLANMFLAFSDKTRLRLIGLMHDGEVSVGFLSESLGESQPKTSRHLAYLRNAGVVTTRREGKWVYYALQDQAGTALEEVLAATLNSLGDDNGASQNPSIRRPAGTAVIDALPEQVLVLPQADMWADHEDELPVYLL